MRRFLIPTMVLVAGGGLVAVLSAARSSAPSDELAVEVSGPMPAVDRRALVEGRVRPSDYRGKVVVVNFWASWCAPCREEQPGLQRLHEELGDRVSFVGVNFQDDRAAALAYLEEFGVTYPSVADPDGQLAYRFGVPFLPATIIADARGEMRYRLVGEQTESTLRRYLAEVTPVAG
ncbi:MAG TPA: TlpA disulfide reductase family protein [Actinomycetota bacterium]|nr:TlpA disulfide reductase family protein [Actinomycetota bacterium]